MVELNMEYSEALGIAKGPIIQYELNEVPWRVIDWYLKLRPQAALAKLLTNAISLTSVTHDEGELHPWTTWLTLHRGIYNTQHKICFLNQDLSTANQWPPIWEVLAKAGKRVGVFGSLHSYPIPPNLNFEFYIPDTFARGAETYPQKYSAFQRINLQRTQEDSAVTATVKLNRQTLQDLILLKFLGVKFKTYHLLAKQLVNERINSLFKSRRSILQAPFAFDIFCHVLQRHKPDFCTFFTNHVAGMMHRYWKYAFPEDFNYQLTNETDQFYQRNILLAMDIADQQIAWLRRYVDLHNGHLLIVSSMGQSAVDIGDYQGEIRLENFKQFAEALQFNKPLQQNLSMQPDCNFTFTSEADLHEFCDKAKGLTDSQNNPLVARLRISGLTINMCLMAPIESLKTEQLFWQQNDAPKKIFSFTELGLKKIWRDMGTGYHQPKGIFICYQKNLMGNSCREEIESIRISPMIIKALLN